VAAAEIADLVVAVEIAGPEAVVVVADRHWASRFWATETKCKI
jgi:hypothetical protein